MYSITYIGSDFDQSESVKLHGVTYERYEAVVEEHLHPEIDGNPTFNVENLDEPEEEPKEAPKEEPKVAPKTSKRKKAAPSDTPTLMEIEAAKKTADTPKEDEAKEAE